MYINNLMLEVTRKCNLKCVHCMRGCAQNKSMNKQTMFQLFQHVDEVYELTIGGGEPSLALQQMDDLWNALLQCDTKVDHIFLVHNGYAKTNKLLAAWSKLNSICMSPDDSRFTISNDIYHQEQRTERNKEPIINIEELIQNYHEYIDKNDPNGYEWLWYKEAWNEDTDAHRVSEHTTNASMRSTAQLLKRGRAKNYANADPKEYHKNIHCDNADNPTKIFGEMYVTYDGNILGDANMCYNDMKKYILGNVAQWYDFTLKLPQLSYNKFTHCIKQHNGCTDCFSYMDIYEDYMCDNDE